MQNSKRCFFKKLTALFVVFSFFISQAAYTAPLNDLRTRSANDKNDGAIAGSISQDMKGQQGPLEKPESPDMTKEKGFTWWAPVRVFASRQEMGKAAADTVAKQLRTLLDEKTKEGKFKNLYVTMLLAAAPSQDEFYDELVKAGDINWNRVVVFHLDEYLDLPDDHPNTFKVYLQDHFLSKLPAQPKVYFIKDISGKPSQISKKYYDLIQTCGGIDIACIGIGENGHIGFNEPGSDFNDRKMVREIILDEQSVKQQFEDYKNDPNPAKRYKSLEDVPRNAITVTIPGILSARFISVVVPDKRKAQAVKNLMTGEFGPACPATALRTHKNTAFFFDWASAVDFDFAKWTDDARKAAMVITGVTPGVTKAQDFPRGLIYSEEFIKALPQLASNFKEDKVAIVVPNYLKREELERQYKHRIIVAGSVNEAYGMLSSVPQDTFRGRVKLTAFKYFTTDSNAVVPVGVDIVIVAESVVRYLGAIQSDTEELDKLNDAIREILEKA